MTTNQLRVGQRVRVPWLHDRQGTVEAIEGDVAHVAMLSDGSDYWARLDDLTPVIPWPFRVYVANPGHLDAALCPALLGGCRGPGQFPERDISRKTLGKRALGTLPEQGVRGRVNPG